MAGMGAEWEGKTWMAKYWHAIGGRKITDIVLPGSHDSATAALTREIANDDGGFKIRSLRRIFGIRVTDAVATPWCQCQCLSIMDQLELGVRYLDLRVREFCSSNSSEFVVLDLRHLYLRLPEGEEEQDALEEEAHACLVSQLDQLLGSLLVSSSQWLQPLNTIAGRVFLFYGYERGDGRPGGRPYACPTFWRDWLIDMQCVDSPWPRVPHACQLPGKMDLFLRRREEQDPQHSRLFVLQGVVTEEAREVVAGILSWLCLPRRMRAPRSIREQARIANPRVLDHVSHSMAPAAVNVVLFDWLCDHQVVSALVHLNVAQPRDPD